MGTRFSSNKDYNRTLARQPPKSVRISLFQVPENLQQEPLAETLSIPVPVRNTQVNQQTPISTEKPLPPKPNTELIKSNPSPPVIDRPAETISEKPLLPRSSSITLQTNPIMNRNPAILSRSVMNLDDDNRLNHSNFPQTSSSFRSTRSIVERNGSQFLTEIKHRMERRYIQIYDQNENQMRLFEVTDYIPSRTVRSLSFNRPFRGQSNAFSQRSIRPNLSLSHRLPLPPRTNNRGESNLANFNDLNNRDTLNRQFDSYTNGVPNPRNVQPSNPKLEPQRSTDSDYNYSKPEPYNSSSVASRESENKAPAQPALLPKRSPTQSEYSHSGSDYSHSGSDENSTISEDNDSEGFDPTSPSNRRQSDYNSSSGNISYGTAGGRSASEQIDLFKKPVNPRIPIYSKRGDFNSYSQPMMNNRGLQSNSTTDYTPIRVSRTQTKRNPYASRHESDTYDG